MHPAYILGHLDLFDHYVLMSVNEKPPRFDPAAGLNRYGPKGMALLRSDLCERKSWYIQRLQNSIEGYRSVLRSLSDDAFTRENPYDELRAEFPKVADLFAYVPCHESQHADDLAQWRKLVGYPLKESRRFKP